MKFNRVLCMLAMLALTSLAFAGPHDFNTFTANDGTVGNFGAQIFYARSDGAGNALVGSNVAVNNGLLSSGNYSFHSTIQWNLPNNAQDCSATGAPAPDDGDYCSGQDLVYSTGTGAGQPITSAFGAVINRFFDNQSNGTGHTGQTESIAAFGTGASTFFWTADTDLATGAQSFGASNFYEVDINIHIAPDPSNTPGTDPGVDGVWRLGFGISSTNNGTTTLAIGNGGNADASGRYALVSGTPTCSGSCDGTPNVVFSFVDSEFDPTSSVPEPTTLLLLGSGMLALARRFRS